MNIHSTEKGGAIGWVIAIIVILIALFFILSNRSATESPIVDDGAMMEEGKDGDAMMMEKDGEAMHEEDEMHGHSFVVTINNVSDTQPLSPGVFVTHTSDTSLNFLGGVAPDALESLAEFGDNNAFAEFVAGVPGVSNVYRIDEPILPGEARDITVFAADGEMLSGIQMAVGSNDGYALLDAAALNETVPTVTVVAENHDAGTEENSELGSGFDGGQPDPGRGEENIENGTATDPKAPVALHDQLVDPIMEVTITFTE